MVFDSFQILAPATPAPTTPAPTTTPPTTTTSAPVDAPYPPCKYCVMFTLRYSRIRCTKSNQWKWKRYNILFFKK